MWQFWIDRGGTFTDIVAKKPDGKIIIDNLDWNGIAKKSGLDIGDIINEFKIENQNRPKKEIVYPIALILLLVSGYLNFRRKT